MKAIRWFIISAGMLLIITAAAKIASGFGNARVLGVCDRKVTIG
jgi:hypothetical protein